MTRPRVVVAGLGDTGLLTAIHLSRRADVVGISVKPGLVSGQELGLRLSRPAEWARDYWIRFDRFRRLDQVRTVHGTLTGLDREARTVAVRDSDGTDLRLPYDALVISTGVSNGFWRRPDLQTAEEIDAALEETHRRLARADSVMVIGAGAAAVSAALNLKVTWPTMRVDLYFPGEGALPRHHRKVWQRIEGRLRDLGVGLHPGHRAEVPTGFEGEEITADPVSWSTGQPAEKADAVIWAIGRVRPNTGWLPADLLDDDGFVRVDEHLRVIDQVGIHAIGDVAATDPLRSSARSRADHLLAHNVLAGLHGRKLKTFTPARRRWGSVVGTQANALEVFTPTGQSFRLRPWSVLQPWVVRRAIYQGIRRA
jgi:NADH dehydrogenase FAD-containing subunit